MAGSRAGRCCGRSPIRAGFGEKRLLLDTTPTHVVGLAEQRALVPSVHVQAAQVLLKELAPLRPARQRVLSSTASRLSPPLLPSPPPSAPSTARQLNCSLRLGLRLQLPSPPQGRRPSSALRCPLCPSPPSSLSCLGLARCRCPLPATAGCWLLLPLGLLAHSGCVPCVPGLGLATARAALLRGARAPAPAEITTTKVARSHAAEFNSLNGPVYLVPVRPQGRRLQHQLPLASAST
ncbi:hypothetical protein EJ04DRAFT_256101 [Polyplosphaeria fusca]|uniref:Uncharacterized protein n=1 Tax=Polyplosphaeria fusca TaxID=682080 RepID=A0A9P4UZB3_9PLEO|nr:hypothetical protein EJ04DRAFT_256101 [Polyplosphaeria fusca]